MKFRDWALICRLGAWVSRFRIYVFGLFEGRDPGFLQAGTQSFRLTAFRVKGFGSQGPEFTTLGFCAEFTTLGFYGPWGARFGRV